MWDAAALARLKGLRLRARKLAEGVVTGAHRGPRKGVSREFSEHRPYVRGDEVRTLDWKVYGKTDRYFIKQFQEERSLQVSLLLDASASMGYASTGPLTKWDYALSLAGALAYLAVHDGDAAGALLSLPAGPQFIPPRPGEAHLEEILRMLEAARPEGPTRLEEAAFELSARLVRRGLVVVCSDLLEDTDRLSKGLALLRSRRHQVMVWHLLDPAELSFPFEGEIRLTGLEGPAPLELHAETFRPIYQDRVRVWLEEVESRCRRAGVEYHRALTDRPADEALHQALA